MAQAEMSDHGARRVARRPVTTTAKGGPVVAGTAAATARGAGRMRPPVLMGQHCSAGSVGCGHVQHGRVGGVQQLGGNNVARFNLSKGVRNHCGR